MALLEKEAIRFAESLDDYDYVSVTEIGGRGPTGFWVVVRDERLDISYEITSHCDYWDFIARFASGTRWPVKPFASKGVA